MFTGFFLLLDGVIYNLIRSVYRVFDFLARVNIFNDDAYQDISRKIYVILGLIMMFVLAYTLLRAVMNPDDFTKGEKSFPSLIKNIVISLALIVVMPAIFSFAMDFQAAILDNNTIYRFILGRENIDEGDVDAGTMMAYYTFTSFFYPSEEYCTDGSGNMTIEQAETCKETIESNWTLFKPSTWFSSGRVTLAEVDELVLSDQASFTYYREFADAANDNEIAYNMFVSTIAGIFILYVLINFCFDVAVRVIKLAFYQLIAPIPIICRILPGGNMKDVFDKWTKQTISVYIEVFIRIAVIALGVYLLQIVIDTYNAGIPGIESLGFLSQMAVRILLIMSVIIFIRQAPKLLGDLFHLDTGGMKLGIGDKLAMGGGLLGLAAFSGVGGGVSSAVKRFNNLKKNGAGTGRALLGATAALGAGATRSVYGARKAKNIGDINKARSDAVTNTLAAGGKRDQRKAERKQLVSDYEQKHGEVKHKYIAGLGLGAIAGMKRMAGIDPYKDLKAEQDFNSEIIKIDDNSDSVAADLLQRDAFSSSGALVSAATDGTYSMAYSAMQKRVGMLGASDYNSIKGTTVEDFKGNSYHITNENQYAMYQSFMESQLREVERKTKKYIKQQGYASNGLEQLKALNIDLGDGELQRLSKLQSDRASVESLLRENETLVTHINQAAKGANITSLSDGTVAEIEGAYNQMDALVNNAKNDNIRIRSQFEELQRRQPPSSSK